MTGFNESNNPNHLPKAFHKFIEDLRSIGVFLFMKLNTTHFYQRNVLPSSRAPHIHTPPKQQHSDRMSFRGTTEKPPEKIFTRKERMNAAWNALKKDMKTPSHKIIMLSGFIGLVAIPSVIIASLLFPVALPVLYPIAAGSSVFSGVALWRSFEIVRPAYKNPSAQS